MMQSMFSDAGYNLPSEISKAFALEQLKKLDNNIKIRRKNFKKLSNFFQNMKNILNYQKKMKVLLHPG